MYITIAGRRFVEAIGRNPGEDQQHSHLYAVEGDDLHPMCVYGWNRSDGEGFSIYRGHSGGRGLCRICLKNAQRGRKPLREGAPHKTTWI